MSIEITIIVTIISASIALAGLIITGQNGLRREMREQRIEQRKEMQEQRKEMQEQRKEMQEQRKEMQEQWKETQVEFKAVREEIKEQGEKHSKKITEVKLEVAALKATVDTYFRVRVDPPMQPAVAEPPEDYGAD